MPDPGKSSRASSGAGRRSRHRGRRRRHRRHRRPIGPVSVILTVLIAGFVLLAVSHLASGRRNLLLVRANLRIARAALSQRDDATARARLDRAARQVSSAQSSASAVPLRVLRAVPLLGSPAKALAAGAKAGSEGVTAGRIITEASTSFPTSASVTVDGHDLAPFHAAATRSQSAVEDANRHMASAAARLAGPAGAALGPVSHPAKAMKAEVDEGRRQLDGLGRGLALLGDLTAPQSQVRLLLLAQDTLELRPGGGFIGSFGVLEFSRGTVRLQRYQATEDLPDPSPPMQAPPGLSMYLIRPWTISNSNWSPDFPTSATTAVEMFSRQGGGDVDGVIALTELATARLVGALGPLKLPSYPIPVDEDGFELRAVYEVELKRPFDVPRKKFLIELADVLFDRLFNLPSEKLPAVADALRASIGAGDVQLWFKDPARQRFLDGAEVAGRIPQPAGDFVMLVDANLTASKANLELTKDVDYRVERRPDGRLVGHVRVEVRNDGAASQINPLYNSYLRLYVPAGAQLLDPGNPKFDQLARDGPFDVFAQSLIVLPQQQEVATFDYLLPGSIKAGGDYQLTWVRQVGTFRDRHRVIVDGRTVELGPRRSFVLEPSRR